MIASSPTRDLLISLLFNMQSRMQKEMKNVGINLSPMHIKIIHILDATGLTTQKQLREIMGKDKGQIARLVTGLEKEGMIRKKTDRRDSRTTHLLLTPKSRIALDQFLKIEADVQNRLFTDFSETEIQIFNQMLVRADSYWEKSPE